MAQKQNRRLSELLLDPFFYYKLKNKNYNSLDEIPCEKWSGFLIENRNQLEIWFNRKKIYKTNTADMVNQLLLFPLFNIQASGESFTSKKGIYIVNKEIGHLGAFELMTKGKKMLFEDIKIETATFQNIKIITNCSYQNQPLSFIKKETIITQQHGFEVKG
jgi:hypothetical protein